MIILLILNVVFTGLIGVVWSKANWYNVLIKLSVISLCVADLFFLLQSLGYIVKV